MIMTVKMTKSTALKLLSGAALLAAAACGGPDQGGNSSRTAGASGVLSPAAITANVTYRYQNAQPVIVNGKPVLAHKYWACVDTVTVKFPQPMRLATVLGNTQVAGQYNMRKALTLRSYDASYKTFTWAAGSQSMCNDAAAPNRVSVTQGAWSLAGLRLGSDRDIALSFPASRDTLPATNAASSLEDSDTAAPMPPAAHASAPLPCTSSDRTRCFTVTPERLNAAIAGLRAWEVSERNNAIYANDALKLMPLEYLLQPYMAPNRERQYGSPDTLYVLRRAGRFMQLLFPDLKTIPVADISEADGSTPSYNDWQLHPDGAHRNGRDVDVSYITTGTGNDLKSPYHWERNFWFMYGVLESSSVDMVLTAYKDTFVQMAKDAYAQGLVNQHAVGRFATALTNDTGLNHDTHAHVAVSNLLNDEHSRKFTAADDVYNCYLGLKPDSQDGIYNYCDVK